VSADEVRRQLALYETVLKSPAHRTKLLAELDAALQKSAAEVSEDDNVRAGLVASALLNLGEPGEAAKLFARLVELFPDHAFNAKLLAHCRAMQGMRPVPAGQEAAHEELERLGVEMRDPARRRELADEAHARLYAEGGVDAMGTLRAATIAAALVDNGQAAQAAKLFERLAELDPDEPYFRQGLIHCRTHLDDAVAALSACTTALARDPDNFGLLVDRGNVLLRLQRTPEALADFRRALAQPGIPEAVALSLRTVISLREG
jgi:tetratricopeptide (TPR) repeat protein